LIPGAELEPLCVLALTSVRQLSFLLQSDIPSILDFHR